MSTVIHVNSSHLTCLHPLLKWRVLDLHTLREEAEIKLQKNNFYRIIRSLEAKKIIEAYRDPFNKKKYVYLGKAGENELQLKENPTAISTETLLHDIKVSEISRAFLDKNLIYEVELEHQIHDKKNFLIQYKIIPDALFTGERNGKSFKMAFELELTRKNNQRIIEKAKQYQASSFYHYVLYFFSKKRMLEQYKELLEEKLGSQNLEKFMFFSLPELTGKDFYLAHAQGFFRNKEINIIELFKGS